MGVFIVVGSRRKVRSGAQERARPDVGVVIAMFGVVRSPGRGRRVGWRRQGISGMVLVGPGRQWRQGEIGHVAMCFCGEGEVWRRTKRGRHDSYGDKAELSRGSVDSE
jgi:hypothetical protein